MNARTGWTEHVRTIYEATVEVATRHQLDVEPPTVLAEFQAEVGISPRGWVQLRIAVPADSIAQACKTALAIASAATGAPAIACQVMTESEAHERARIAPRQRTPSAS
jgi:hypothetical protein